MPTREKRLQKEAREAAGRPPQNTGQRLVAGALSKSQITADVLLAYPKLLSKLNPDPDEYAEITEAYPSFAPGGNGGQVTLYRVRTPEDCAQAGPEAYPSLSLSLSQIRAQYVALPT